MAIRKRRAMTSRDASRKKIQGHTDEKIFSELIDGKTKAGTGKQDVVDKNGDIHCLSLNHRINARYQAGVQISWRRAHGCLLS